MKRLAVSTFAAALAVTLGAGVFTAPDALAQKKFIAIGTGGPTGVYFVVGQSICRMVHKEAAEGRKKGRKHGIRCAAPSTAGSTYNIANIREGELDFGVAQSDWQFHAYNGSSKFEGKQFKKLRAVFSVHPSRITSSWARTRASSRGPTSMASASTSAIRALASAAPPRS